MRSFDLAPLYRSTVGFDRLFSAIDQLAAAETAGGYPPYDIERTGENDYRITLAVAGFASDELSIETKDGVLSVRGQRRQDEGAERRFLHQGIAARSFERRFQLADHVRVTEANLSDGLLHVGLVREVPEAAKPRRIEIATASNGNAPRVEASQAQAA
jgi:molecular chaperone IbpA